MKKFIWRVYMTGVLLVAAVVVLALLVVALPLLAVVGAIAGAASTLLSVTEGTSRAWRERGMTDLIVRSWNRGGKV